MRNHLRKIYLLLIVLSTCNAYAQELVKIYGDVQSGNTPVGGVSILFKKSKTTSVSDKLGHFTILLRSESDTLVLSSVGYLTVQKVVNASDDVPIHITMAPSTTELHEVIVSSGYQDIPKERATGSYFKLDNQILNQRVTPDILSRLDGITSAVYFDNHDVQAHTIQIRGLSTLNYDNASPLIVLDNFPYAGDINNINPNDVESVTVLKDAAATSIWGAKAGNGVIVITTKKAKANQPASVNFNANITYAARPDLFSASRISNAALIDLQTNLFKQGYYDAAISDPSFPAIPPVADVLNRVRNGEISQAQGDAMIGQYRSQDVRTDMQRYLYRPETRQQYYLNLSGSGKNIRYLVAAGYDKDAASLRGNTNDRLTLRSNTIIDITNKLQVQSDILFTNTSSTNNSPGGFGGYSTGFVSMAPYIKLVNPDGSPVAVDLYYSRSFTDTAGTGKLLDWKYRPLQELTNNDNRSKSVDVLINLGATYKFRPWLKAEVKYQYEHTGSTGRNLQNLSAFATRDYINMFTQINGNTVTYGLPYGSILYKQDGEIQQHAVRGQFDIDKSWKDKHNITAIAGGEIRENTANNMLGTTFGYDPNSLTIKPVDYVNLYPTYDGIYGNSRIPDGTRYTSTVNRFVSVYGNAAYTYDNRYTISLSGRRDAANIFGVSTNQKWVPLWSAGVLWRLDKESFYHVDWLQQLSLRSTYGASGNTSPNQSALTRITYSPASRSPINIPFAGISSPTNPDLRWEQVNTWNTGIDFAFAGNRISGSLEYFTKNSKDLVNSAALDPTVGFSLLNMNSASIFAKGADLTLNTVNVKGKVSWLSTVLLSYIDYKVTKDLNPPSTLGLFSSGTYIFPIIGYNPYEIVTFKWAGINPKNGNPQGYLNGAISEDYAALLQTPVNQMHFVGSAVPTVFGNFRNTISWQRISLIINTTYRLGYYFLKPTTNSNTLITTGLGYSDYDHRWQKTGDELITNVPSFIYPVNSQRDSFYQNASINAEKADNIKVTDIYLGYDLKFNKMEHLKGLSIYAYASQLNWIIWRANKDRIDPDIVFGVRPPVNFSIGCKANF